MTVVLEPPVRWWKCPSCDLVDRTQRPDVHTQFHPCPAFGGANLPLVEVPEADARPRAAHVPVERLDYYGDPAVGTDIRIAAIRTERLDGSNDCTILAPTASMKIT